MWACCGCGESLVVGEQEVASPGSDRRLGRGKGSQVVRPASKPLRLAPDAEEQELEEESSNSVSPAGLLFVVVGFAEGVLRSVAVQLEAHPGEGSQIRKLGEAEVEGSQAPTAG